MSHFRGLRVAPELNETTRRLGRKESKSHGSEALERVSELTGSVSGSSQISQQEL